MALMLAPWHSVFLGTAEVGATLTGLVFVALSINLRTILDTPGLASRAAEPFILLLVPLFLGLAGALPTQPPAAFGAEVVAISLVALSTLGRLLYGSRSLWHLRRGREIAFRVVAALITPLVAITGGAILIAGASAGLWFVAVAIGLCLAAGVQDAWVILIEIHR